jgi:hypothetical protein
MNKDEVIVDQATQIAELRERVESQKNSINFYYKENKRLEDIEKMRVEEEIAAKTVK